jgi:tripartite ATP-independent transporter DctM subunit
MEGKMDKIDNGNFAWFSRRINWLSSKAGYIGSWAIAVIMLLTFCDVILRYFFNSPIRGSFEISTYLMVIVISLNLSYCAVEKTHINITILVDRFSPTIRECNSAIYNFLGLSLFSLITWQSAVQANIIKISGSFSPDLHIPVYPFVWIVFIGSLLFSLVYLRDMIENIIEIVKTKFSLSLSFIVWIGIVLLMPIVILFLDNIYGKLDPIIVGLIGIGFLLLLLLFGVHVGIAICITGFLGITYLIGRNPGFGILETVPYSTWASYNMSIIPLFLLMGEFASQSGLTKDLFRTMNCWLGRLPGGLAMATVGACAGFAAVSGSGLATAATLGKIAIPEMNKYRYDSKLAAGAVAAGGTIGILIPPSVILVLYGILTEQSIGKLFLAGFIPGITEALFYIFTIYILCKKNPALGPVGTKTTFTQKLKSLKFSWGIIALFSLVMGSIYFGICSPTEAAGMGAFGSFLYVLGGKRLNLSRFVNSIMEAGKTTGMIFLIITGTMIFTYFLSITRIPTELSSYVTSLNINPYFIIIIIVFVYLFFGCFIGATGLVLLTVPIFFPVVVDLGFNPLWFGIIVVRACEMGSITPPIGMTVYALSGVVKGIPIQDMFRGVIPFFIADIVHLSLLIGIPQISLFLPSLLN